MFIDQNITACILEVLNNSAEPFMRSQEIANAINMKYPNALPKDSDSCKRALFHHLHFLRDKQKVCIANPNVENQTFGFILMSEDFTDGLHTTLEYDHTQFIRQLYL